MKRQLPVLAAALLFSTGLPARAQSISALYLQGQPAPSTGQSYQSFDRPNISAAGSILFTGDTDGDTAFDDFIYLDATLIARQSDPAPGTPGTFQTFESFQTAHQFNASGDAAFISTLAGVPTTANRAVHKFVHSTATLSPVAVEGAVAPGIAGRLLFDFGYAGIADNGDVGFLADLDGATTDDSVIYRAAAILYRQADLVPAALGLAPGATWDADFSELQWNGAGDLLFLGNTSLASNDQMLVRRRGALQEIAIREGHAVAASGGPDTLFTFLQSALAENGAWGMRGTLALAGAASDAIVLTESGFQAQEGDPVPELPGAVLGNFNAIAINSLGDVVYLADLVGAPVGVTEGLFLNGDLIVTTGVAIPALPPGTSFNDIGFEDIYINDSRTVVFAAGYTGAVVGDGLFTFTAAAPAAPGDTNCDSALNGLDVGPFVLALLDPAQYALDYPGCDISSADANGDLAVNQADIAPLAACLLNGACP
jgi:hypothetical protein